MFSLQEMIFRLLQATELLALSAEATSPWVIRFDEPAFGIDIWDNAIFAPQWVVPVPCFISLVQTSPRILHRIGRLGSSASNGFET